MNSSDMKKTTLIILSSLAAYLVLSLILTLAGISSFLISPGAFLYSCYHLSGFYIPLLLFAFAWMVGKSVFPKRLFYSLVFSLVPFFTAALAEGILRETGPVSRYFLVSFGRPMSLLLLSLLTAVEILLIIKGGEYFFSSSDEGEEKNRKIDLNKVKEYLADTFGFSREEEHPAPVEKPVLKTNLEGSRDTIQYDPEADVEWEDVDLEPMNQPEFPPPADPVPEDPRETSGSDPVQEMIRQVLTGQNRKRESLNDVPPEPDDFVSFRPSLSAEEDTDDEPVFEKPFAPSYPIMPPPPVEKEEITEEQERLTPPEYPSDDGILEYSGYREEIDPAYDFLSSDESEEEQLNHLIHDLDETLSDTARELEEETRPESISDKLAPLEEEGTFSDAPEPPRPRRRTRGTYKVPVDGILATYPDEGNKDIDDETRHAARILEETLREFKIEAEVTGISRGPVITMFELLPAPGVKLNRIVALQDNIALRLAASRVRIVAPIPGKHAVGIEIPNKKRSIVAFSDLVMCRDMKKKDTAIPIVLGEDISGDSQVIDLARTPHLLIAGATGAGKSVCVNSLICSILYHRDPDDVKMILVDPKIVELKLYNDIPHLLTPVITEPKRAFQAIQWALYEMERRYALLDGMGVRDIKTYNKRILEREIATTKLPYIVVVIDEFADLMATSGKELEGIVARLAAMSRAVGIHLVLATQRPSTDVITGLIKANFPSRVAFMVASMTDSRIIIDSAGAEKLLGRGDMLFTSSWDPFPSRVQGAFLSEDEVERVVSYVKTLGEPDYIDDEIFIDEPDDDFELKGDDGSDDLFDEALDIVIQSGKASASYLQRRLKIGYNRAARLVEEMEMRGIVGPANGSKPRDILHMPG